MSARKKSAMPEPVIAAVIPTESHVVTRDGLACTLINVSGLGKGGVLIPGSPVVMFDKVRDGERAIKRTERVRETLSTSLVADWMREQMPSFLAGSSFAVVPCGHQKAAGAAPALVAAKPQPQPALQHA